MKLKILAYLTALALILCFNRYAKSDEIITSSTIVANAYLVFYSSMTPANKTTIKTVLMRLSDNPEPSKRYNALYNSDNAICKFSDYHDTDIKIDTSTTRIWIMFDSDYDSTIQTLSIFS